MTAMPSLRRVNVLYTLVQLTYWAAFAAFAGYQTALLLGRGFSSGAAGVFAATRCLTVTRPFPSSASSASAWGWVWR